MEAFKERLMKVPLIFHLVRELTRTGTLNASERAYQAFPRTRRITVSASGEWTAARHLIGYLLTNRVSPTPLARRMPFLSAISALV